MASGFDNPYVRNLLPAVLLLSLGFVWLVIMQESQRPSKEVKSLVEQFYTYKKNQDYKALKNLYSLRAKINIEHVYKDGTPSKNNSVFASHFYNLAYETKSLTQQLNAYEEFSDVRYKRTGDDFIVSSIRYSNLDKSKTPHILVLSEYSYHKWIITKEYIVEYEN